MSRTTLHVCQSISGALKNWTKSQWSAVAKDNGMTVSEVKNEFLSYLRDGKEVIPLTDQPCEGFSYQTGCPGHPIPETPPGDSG